MPPIFDALNDVRNLETAIKATKKYGGICEVAMSYTVSPVHTEDYFVKLAQQIEELGADTICIKEANVGGHIVLFQHQGLELLSRDLAVAGDERCV